MSRDDDDPFAPPRKPPEHVLGQPLEDLSIEELNLRIEALKAEIGRLEEARGPRRPAGRGPPPFSGRRPRPDRETHGCAGPDGQFLTFY